MFLHAASKNPLRNIEATKQLVAWSFKIVKDGYRRLLQKIATEKRQIMKSTVNRWGVTFDFQTHP